MKQMKPHTWMAQHRRNQLPADSYDRMSQYDTPKVAESLVSERIINPLQYVCTGLWIINLGAESEIAENDELLFANKPRFARRATTSPKKKPHPKAGKRAFAANWLCSRVLMDLLSLETSNTLRGNFFRLRYQCHASLIGAAWKSWKH